MHEGGTSNWPFVCGTDHLNLRFLWSAKQEVISVQIWATVILAQMLHALQVRVAAEARVSTFDVSLELLLRHIPDFIRQGGDLLTRIQEGAYPLGIIRPSTRKQIEVPLIERSEIIPPPIDLIWIRPPRYAHRQGQPGRGNQKRRKKKEPGVVDATPVKTEAACQAASEFVGVGGGKPCPYAFGGHFLLI
jgi:hypothetical protein